MCLSVSHLPTKHAPVVQPCFKVMRVITVGGVKKLATSVERAIPEDGWLLAAKEAPEKLYYEDEIEGEGVHAYESPPLAGAALDNTTVAARALYIPSLNVRDGELIHDGELNAVLHEAFVRKHPWPRLKSRLLRLEYRYFLPLPKNVWDFLRHE